MTEMMMKLTTLMLSKQSKRPAMIVKARTKRRTRLMKRKIIQMKSIIWILRKRNYHRILNKDAQKDDMWIFMRERLVTTQKLKDINDFIFVKTWWHGLGKRSRIKVKLIGNPAIIKPKLSQYKFALRSINVGQYASLINNLINFRDSEPNLYLDNVLYINQTKYFKPLMELDRKDVIPTKEYFSSQFNLNMDQK